MRPKSAPDAPAVTRGVDASWIAILPPSNESVYSTKNRLPPSSGSSKRPMTQSPSMFMPICSAPMCR